MTGIPGASFFTRLRRSRNALQVIESHVPTYIRTMHSDLAEFREEIIKTAVGATLAAAAGLMFIAFCSIAIIVSAWNSQFRSVIAWMVCGFWAILAIIGLALALRALRGPVPFAKFTSLLIHDLTRLREQL